MLLIIFWSGLTAWQKAVDESAIGFRRKVTTKKSKKILREFGASSAAGLLRLEADYQIAELAK